MNVTFGFLITGKKRVRKPLKVRTFFFEKGYDLFARGAVDVLVGDMTFPVRQKAVFFTQRPESPSLQKR